jgi:hypothetical protein
MRILKTAFILVGFAILSVNIMCRKAYEPPEIKASNHFLAIDGVINTGTGATSVFTLSRSLSLTDSLTNLPELHADNHCRCKRFELPPDGFKLNRVYVSDP